MDDALSLAGKLLSESLKRQNCRIVFAESCTAGLASATLAETPGVSQWHCGSAVTYRYDTKARWLNVPADLLDKSRGPGAVSEPVARAMALGVLALTPEAAVAAAITGDLGPNPDQAVDGLIWIAVARRDAADSSCLTVVTAVSEILPNPAEPGITPRKCRQRLAAQRLLEVANEIVEGE